MLFYQHHSICFSTSHNCLSKLCLASSLNISSRLQRQVGANRSYHVIDDDVKIPLYFLALAHYPDSEPFSPSWVGGLAIVAGSNGIRSQGSY